MTEHQLKTSPAADASLDKECYWNERGNHGHGQSKAMKH